MSRTLMARLLIFAAVAALVLVGCKNPVGAGSRSDDANDDDGRDAGDAQSVTLESVDFNMHYVPPKSFPTGTDDDGTSEVTEAYWIAETEVTYGVWDEVHQWATVGVIGAGAGEYTFANSGTQGNDDDQTDEHPVTEISWRDAMVWTNALTEYYNAQTDGSLEPVYYTDSGYNTPIRSVDNSTDVSDDEEGSQDNPYVKEDADGFRLPTKDEWELAARFVEDTDGDGDIEDDGEYYRGDYASGADADHDDISATREVAWYGENAGSQTHSVAQKEANALGLYDMSGNVKEWNFDSTFYLTDSRVIRGGAWNSSAASFLQVGSVYTTYPYNGHDDDGFRPARNAE